jgi:hypothetical protein
VACKVFPRMNKTGPAAVRERLFLQEREDQGREQTHCTRKRKNPGRKAAADSGGSA